MDLFIFLTFKDGNLAGESIINKLWDMHDEVKKVIANLSETLI